MTLSAVPFSLAGKRGLILGLANLYSIAHGCAQAFDGLMQRAREQSPLQRLVTLQEVGQLAAASDAASAMTGQTIYIDAGYHVAG
jgi:enoyl-[acyl-carrier-protein] reductase (NADH)